ncbi:substrate-binding domain-containing protein [Galbitalea soli]|uniref:Substrate-binding domain-containing protein n=1 Tax=Galbitalea soli TaxID=1268042 RepID=A0A7C9PPF4_9MICO|nr:substrate-binding domain-containing protein [Galbitalea soli]NEM92354.1 substrate-binding domain-containing protein [Galbitalea soli]NYJ31689.1 ribose transport system substrate-binding protein [Galbitalea soli]
MNLITQSRRARMAAGAAVVVVALALAGCSSTNATTSGSKTDTLKADIAAGSVGTVDQFTSIDAVCGTKPVTVAVVDGYGTNSWSKTVKAEIDSEAAKCPAIKSVSYTAGRGDLAATNSAITGAAAKGTNILLVIPDAGPGQAQLAAVRKATKAGTIVVPFASDPTGKAGTDYLDYTDQVAQFSGSAWAQWVVDNLGSKGGTVVFLGGPAGAAVSTQEFVGVKAVLDKNPQVKLLTPEPVTTNWDPAQAQQAMAGLLSQYPKIDAVIADYGASASGAIRAYQAAGVSVPLLTSTDDNSLSCGFTALKAKNPSYQLATVSSRTWIGRVALRKALAAFYGKSDTEPSMYNLHLFEDSTGKTAGAISPSKACLPAAPTDASPSSLLTTAEFTKIFG